MMKPYWIGATLAVAFTGAVGVGAGSTVNMKGSDTLFDFTNAVIAACPGTMGPYAGTGSGNGEGAMVAGTQQIAPMSRFLTNKVCSGPGASPTTSQGLVVALDSIAILGSNQTFGTTACNGDSNTACDVNFEPTTGAAYDTTVAGYTFNGWRDVLRVLLAGFTNDIVGTGAAQWAARDCNSAIRQTLANSYGNFFENNCSATTGDAGGVCTQIRHIFRRDDFSGTTDTVVGLLGLPSIVSPETMVTVYPNGVKTTVLQHTGANPFCNAVRPAFVYPQSAAGKCSTATCTTTCGDGSACTGGMCTTNNCTVGGTACGDASTCVPSAPEPTCLGGPDSTWDATSANSGPGFCQPLCATGLTCVNGACIAPPPACSPACTPGQICSNGVCINRTACVPPACCPETSVYRATMQDNDPIRRTCFGAGNVPGAPAEDVCSHSGDLGLVLPMNDAPENGGTNGSSNADRYNATPCSGGRVASVGAPDIYDAVTQAKIICNRGLLCPGGDVCNLTGGCLAPADPTGNPQCISNKVSFAGVQVSPRKVPLINPVIPGKDSRAYNQHLYKILGSAGTYQYNAFATPFPMTGAYFRIHTNHSLAPHGDASPPPLCQLPDMTDQIGCLVNASPCSLGYAGRQALTTNPNTAAVKLNKQSPVLLCIQAHFLYPMSRKLYLNTLVGFQSVTGQELNLSGCETDLPQPSLVPPTPGGVVTSAVAAAGFIPIFPQVNLGEPFCEDFNEFNLCGIGSGNVDTCTTAPTNLDNFPTFDTVCGDGNVDSYEDCDNGTHNGPPPATCSTTCRFN
jgi:hypothetical protein